MTEDTADGRSRRSIRVRAPVNLRVQVNSGSGGVTTASASQDAPIVQRRGPATTRTTRGRSTSIPTVGRRDTQEDK